MIPIALRIKASIVAPLALAAVPLASARPGSGEVFVRRELTNGMQLHVLAVKDAPKQTFFAFLPLGLAYDDAGRAQWSHLLEHLLLRSTDPEGLSDGAIVFNGETSDGAVRLDVHAPPAQAAKAAAKLAAWLRARDFDAEVLEREKKNVAAELAGTAPRGFTHKWATAAWAQVVRHGATEAALLGDVERATAEELADYAREKLADETAVHLYSIGPLGADEAKRLLEAQLAGGGGLDALAGALGGGGKPASGPRSQPGAAPAPLATGDLETGWDVPRAHLLEWYLLPDATPADRARAALLANALAIKLQSDPALMPANVIALASADVVLPQGRVLLLSASLPDAAAKDRAASAFRRAIDGLEQLDPIGGLDAFLAMARTELSGEPDFAAVRRQWSARARAPGAPALDLDLVEAQLGLALAARERSSRLSFAELAAATAPLASKDLLALRTQRLAAAHASRLLLSPSR